MAAHEDNPFSKSFRERKKREREERERQEREARERHEREERERQEREAQERYEREERERQERETRERHEREECERQEREIKERHEREERERQKREIKEQHEREERELQEIEAEKKQIKLKEAEEIKQILKDEFKTLYKAEHFLKLLSNLQYLYSISSTKNIEYVDILYISNQANCDEILDLKTQISTKLPKIPGNFSVFMTIIDDGYATMVMHNTNEGIKVKFNDPRGVAMPLLLKQTIVEILGTEPIDLHTRIEGPTNIIAVQNLLEFITLPKTIILIPESLDPEQSKLLKVLHVLYSCDLLQDIIPEADQFLKIFYTAHTVQNPFATKASIKAILDYYSTFENIKEHDLILLSECHATISALPDSDKRLIPQNLTEIIGSESEDEDFVMLDDNGLYDDHKSLLILEDYYLDKIPN